MINLKFLKRLSLIPVVMISLLTGEAGFSQSSQSGTFLKPVPANYEVKQAIEIESLVPMYFFGGYHIGAGYRYKHFRARISVINGGTFDAEKLGLNNSSPGYKRYYTTSPGLFLGYNIWKNLEIYGYYENHTYKIEQVASAEKKNLRSDDMGIGISYQFFIGRTFYIQPGFHTYFRGDNSVSFSDNGVYSISNTDLSVVVRLGARIWKRY